MTHPGDDRLEEVALRLLRLDSNPLSAPAEGAATLRACKGRGVANSDWHIDESEYGILIYSLKQDGWRRGEPVMVNDITVRIENANGSHHDLRPIAGRILSVLTDASDADDHDLTAVYMAGERKGWNAAIRAAYGKVEPVHAELARTIRALWKDHPHD